ncbi:MAG: hypothetical protein EP340_03935 [Alphaproteobacteria bacterium]|nr:MAG: hypothetical protein EP340_03935 [Alphaproteobacteria bacterium]
MSDDLAGQAREIAARLQNLSTGSADKPVFAYLDLIGIGWPIRCLLHLKQIDYELISIPIQVWLQTDEGGEVILRKATNNAHVPLYVDGEVSLNQSLSILEYLGDKHGLMGDTPAERWGVKEVMAHAYDALFSWGGLLPIIAKINVPDGVVEARLQAFLGDGPPWGIVGGCYGRNLKSFENYLDANAHNAGGFMVGSRLSVADLHAFNVLCNWYKAFDPERFKAQHPKLNDFVLRIAAIPEVRDYIQNHQEATTWLPIPPLGLRLTTPEALVGLIDE